MGLAQTLYFFGIIAVFATFGVSLMSVWLYVNLPLKRPTPRPQERQAVPTAPSAWRAG